ncbi:MAG: hypothetical protein COA32_10990 [Fluviicola sp.]|nr:MAG: hypothetical protein COA32_10990 [Fluviicola sp.]
MKQILAITVLSALTLGLNAQTGNETLGTGAGTSITSGDYNVLIGDSSGYSITTGLNNTFLGYRAGLNQTSQWDNIYIGMNAGLNSTTGTDNTIIGTRAAQGLGLGLQGTDNVVIGTEAGLEMNGYANDNVIIGEEAGQSLIDGDDNVFVGEDAGYNTTTANDNTFIGNQAGYRNTTGYRNVFVGNDAGWDNTTGYWNTAIGDSAGTDFSVGIGNTMLGHAAGAATEYSSYNTFLGHNAGWDNNRTNGTTGEGLHNTYIGANTGYTNREGNYNVGLGAYADFRATGYTGTNDNIGNVFIGYESMVDEMESVAIGYYSRVYGRGTVAIGAYSDYDYNSTDYSVGLGWTGHANNASNSVGIGREHYLQDADQSIGIGAYDTITADYGMAIGYDATSSANYASAYGYESNSAAEKSMTFGYQAHIDDVNAVNSVAIGHNATALDSNVMILGNNTTPLRLGIGTTAPNTFASIDLAETNKGFMMNRLTSAERTTLGTSLTASEEGLMVFDTDDDQTYTWDGTTWSTPTFTEVDGDVTNEIQDISLTGTDLTLTSGSTIDLSVIDTDTQLTESEVDAFVANNGYLTSFSEVDGDVTNEIQDISLTGTDLTLTSGSTIDLSVIDTDTQLTEAEVDAFVANNGYLTSFSEVDGDVTNEIQDISLTGTDLTLTSGSTVDLSVIDTDTQLTEAEVDAFVANNGYLTSFSEVDGDVTNEIQDISLTGTDLTLTSGSTVDLSSIDTDTDEQDLTAATLTGTTLDIEIENGASVSVDLAPLLVNLQSQINDLETRLTLLEGCACDSTAGLGVIDGNTEKAILYQNIPNPFNNTSSIKYYIPSWATSANLVVSDGMGKIVSNTPINEVGGYGTSHVNAEGLNPGTYYYSLYVNQTLVDTKKMVVQ